MRTAIGLLLLFLASAFPGTAQQPAAKAAAKPASRPAAMRAEAGASIRLPVTRVSLYKDGVGFFEHSGRVSGNQAVTIDFTTAQLNDVLQTLTAVDLNGGRIAGADYNSTTPLDQQLKALALSLPEKATFSTLFTALRGARVQISGSGAPFTGRIVDIEMHKTGPGKDQAGMTEGRFLTVAAESGQIRIFQITPSLTVRLLDTSTGEDLTQYLKVLDSNRDQGLRHLTLEDNGTGPRELHVSYLSEVPIWKSTYRILFAEPKSGAAAAKQTATLQGWSVVDNTTGSDWVNVQLSLIAGAPQSFIQPLSVPYYSRRPEIGLPQEAQLTPQTHESGETIVENSAVEAVSQGRAMGSGNGNGIAGGLAGLAAGSGGNYGGSIYTAAAPPAPAQLDRNAGTLGGSIGNELYSQLALNSVNPNTTTAAFDDYFAYNLTEPITIRKNESALVPILQTSLPAESVTLVSYANARVSQPLRALWITNISSLTLDRGSFTIVEDGNFAGEGLLDPIHPDEKRLLSYAADQALHVSTEGEKLTNHITSVTAAKGVLRLNRTDVHEVTLVLHNAAPTRRTVLSEFPVVPGWQLDSDPAPIETTATLYRFRTLVDPGQTVRLHVGARREESSIYTLTQSNDATLTYILSESGNNAALQAALGPILDARRRVADRQAAVDKVNARLKDLRSDEDRQRANITALGGADKTSRERFVRDLNATEDQIGAAQKDLGAAQTNLQSAKDDLAQKIASLEIDQTL